MASTNGRDVERLNERRGVIRGGLLVLAIPQGAIGLWALFAPSGWYENFPGAGRSWLPAYGAFDEHLASDVGAFLLALAVLLVFAAIYMERRLIRVALGTYLVFAVPHLVFHLGADDRLVATGDQIASGVSVALTVALPIALLFLSRQRPAHADTAAPTGRTHGALEPASGAIGRFGAWYARRRYGAALAPAGVWAHRPRLSLGYGALELAAERSHEVDERLKLLGETKAAAVVGCEWCMDFGSSLSRAHGLGDEQLRDLPRYRESDAYSELEKTVLDYAAAISATPAGDAAAPRERLRRQLDDAQLVELTAAIAIENLRARFNHALGVESQGFSEGEFCVVPEREPAGNGAFATRA